MDEAEEEKLAAHWNRSGIWPHTAEQDTSISQTESNGIIRTSMYENFCPEVAFDRFGNFASFISVYADEIDRDNMHRMLRRDSAPTDDWRWHWSVVHPIHYSECPLYSLLASRTESENPMEESTREYLERRLANMAEGVVEDSMLAVTLVMTEATKQNALGNSRVWLQYNEAIAETIRVALPQMIRFAFEVSDGRTEEAAPILSKAIARLREDAKAALIKRTSLSAQAFGEKPMYDSLSTKLTKLASESFKKLGDDKREIVSGYSDFVKGELDKPNPDASKVKSWTEKIQLALTAANLAAEVGAIGTALAGFLGT